MPPVPMGTLGTIPTITVGGRVFTDLDNLKILAVAMQGTNDKATFREPNGSAGYTPSGSKRFQVCAVRIYGYNSSAPSVIGCLAQSNNDVGVDGVTTALTSPVYEYGSGETFNMPPTGSQSATSSVTTQPSIAEGVSQFIIANGKYLSWDSLGGASAGFIQVFGYEIT